MDRQDQMDILMKRPNEYLIDYQDLLDGPGGMKYKALGTYWFLTRYGKWVEVHDGMMSDGASSVPDARSNAWWAHDKVCYTGCFSDGTKMSNWQASTIFADILWGEAEYFKSKKQTKKYLVRKWESIAGWFGTFIGGGGEARKNGMFKVREA